MINALDTNDINYDPANEGDTWINYNNNTPRIIATREQLSRMIKAVGLDIANFSDVTNTGTDPEDRTGRAEFAREICDILGRDTNPDFNNCERPSFTDEAGYSELISEVSIYHGYVLYGHDGNEIWTFSDPSAGVDI